MKIIEITSRITEYPGIHDLVKEDRELLEHAIRASKMAYAPYSNFFVGAALRLDNGEICLGNNQENAAYPSGICAERVAIFSASATHPGAKVICMAVVAHTPGRELIQPISPCGACRQVLAEYEMNLNQPICLLLMGASGPVYKIDGVKNILPLMFSRSDLGK